MKSTDYKYQNEVDPLGKVFMDWFWYGYRIFQMFPGSEEKKNWLVISMNIY